VVPDIVAVVHWIVPSSSTMPMLSLVANPVAEVSDTEAAAAAASAERVVCA
jgi:hypothetical protein